MHVDRNVNEAKYREKCLELHKKRIIDARVDKKAKVTSQTMDELDKRNQAKAKAHEHTLYEKEAAIRKGNQKLLDKLIEISSGKSVVRFG